MAPVARAYDIIVAGMLRRLIDMKAAASADPLSGGWSRSRAVLWLIPGTLLALVLTLTVTAWQAEVRLAQRFPGRSPYWVLWGGVIGSVAIAVAVFVWLVHRGRIDEQTRRHLQAIESLSGISTAISSQLGGGAGVLDQLAGSACRLLGMSRAIIALLDERKSTLEVVAFSGDIKEPRGRTHALDKFPACKHCLASGQIVFASDVRQSDVSFGRDAIDLFDVRSAVLLPLQVRGRRIGVMALLESQTRSFGEFDRRLAELLASQAAVIISNTRLYEQMRSALSSKTRLLRQRQALAEANAAVQSTDTISQSLSRITTLAPSVLGADFCGMMLLSGNTVEGAVAAATPPFDFLVGAPVAPPAPLAEEALRTRLPQVIADARRDSRVHPVWRQIPNIGSLLYVPMFRSDRQPLGILVLLRYTTGKFTREQIELAQSFSALASVAVENARLLEQTRRDAQAKTVLLRELNHRVKNNLSGIVALLTIDPPAMQPEARAWLDRATARIRAMAEAHQLFAGDAHRVSLQSLAAQTLSSLSVVKPADVRVHMDLDGAELMLGTEQAVGLAMVLHELCHNALMHGLQGGGSLTLRARNVIAETASADSGAAQPSDPQNRVQLVRIEVVDEADGPDEGADAAAHRNTGTGQGLDLVQGLVRRELGGRFLLSVRGDGATVATVEFPLVGVDEAEFSGS